MKNNLKINTDFFDVNNLDSANFANTKSRKDDKKEIVVFVAGNFNILHPGHLRLLKYAKGLSDKLVVGVFSDNMAGSDAHLSEDLRLEGIKCNIWVDNAFIIDEPLNNIIRKIQPNYVVKGKEHEGHLNPEEPSINSYGGKLVFCSGESSFSSSYLIHQGLLNPLKKNKNHLIPNDYFQRHKLTYNNLNEYIKNFSKLKVCVIGDLIVDEYIDCQPLGMSQEDPTIVVSPEQKRKFIGGAGIVAAHASSLGAKTSFISVIGTDEINNFVRSELKKFRVDSFLVEDDSRPTSLKQRFRAEGKTLLRVSNLHQNSINLKIQNKILRYLENHQNEYDLIVFSDFNYGCLPNNLVQKIINIGKKNKTKMAADSQSSSQLGDITRFKEMDLLTPTEKEIRVGLHNKEDGLVVLAEKLMEKSFAKNIFLKLGSDGVLLHTSNKLSFTDRIPALNNHPRDVAGAGDSMLISSAMAIACGASPWEAAGIGSLASAVQISRIGNIPLSTEDLIVNI